TLSIPLDRYARALNVQLPRDIRVMKVEEVSDDFHARYSVHGKRYRYIWSCEAIQSPFRRFYATPTNGVKPDVKAMEKAAQYIQGTYDFS
ncbi:tRNA pseudouridine(38-40) synthase TruA, partial [Pseudomonas syringae pv. tagetis]